MSTPTTPGTYLYTPDLPDAPELEVEVVRYKGVLCARLPDEDEVELHAVADMSGEFRPIERMT